MKKQAIRTSVLSTAAIAFLGMAGYTTAFAEPTSVTTANATARMHRTSKPHQDYPKWEKPDSSAVWIPGHTESQDGQDIWVGGYYGYAPHQYWHWEAPRFPHTESGYWSFR